MGKLLQNEIKKHVVRREKIVEKKTEEFNKFDKKREEKKLLKKWKVQRKKSMKTLLEFIIK